MTYPAGDTEHDWYAHWAACTDKLCGTWPHRWARTLDGERFIAAERRAEQEQRERQAMR